MISLSDMHFLCKYCCLGQNGALKSVSGGWMNKNVVGKAHVTQVRGL